MAQGLLLALLLTLPPPPAAAWPCAAGGGAAAAQRGAGLQVRGGSARTGEPRSDAPPDAAPGARRALAAGAAAALVGLAASGARGSQAAGGGGGALGADAGIPVYFGQGSFWRVQHDLVEVERRLLGRGAESVTARAGYAGGQSVGNGGKLCYHNKAFLLDYAQRGHAEVVQLSVPESRLREVAKGFFDEAERNLPLGRPANQAEDLPEFRSAIGLPGGQSSPLFPEVQAANGGRLKLAIGQGSDPDTAENSLVWVYDSDQFPFYTAEVYHQFHDDFEESFPSDYKSIKEAGVAAGRIRRTGCPEKTVDPLAEELPREDNFNLAGFGDMFNAFSPKTALPAKMMRNPANAPEVAAGAALRK